LEILYLGGNQLESIPVEVGCMQGLVSLVLCDNRLESLPSSLVSLASLQSLSLHNNRLSTLPPEIIHLNLVELSLRNNPLVVRFVKQMMYEPPTLMELAGRVVKVKNIKYSHQVLPGNLVQYLDSSHSCVNPKCKGVYFTSHVEHVKFVDFCGKYRVPLLQYLCSPKCTSVPSIAYSSESESEDETTPVVNKMKKVLLG
jgi:Leucine-rich repeat (LRR) protein